MAAAVAASMQTSPSTPPSHHRQHQPYPRRSPNNSSSRIQFTSPPSSTTAHWTPFSPFRASAAYRTTSVFSPTSSASVHSAARALTQLRSPNRFQAPLDDDDGEIGYREQATADGSDDEDEEREEKYPDDDDERSGAAPDSLVDLSALLLQLRVDKRRGSPHRQRLTPHAHNTDAKPTPRTALHSTSSPASSSPSVQRELSAVQPGSPLAVAPSALESSIALALQDMQRQYVERAEQAIDTRLNALQTALQSALSPTALPAAASSPSLLSPLSTLTSLHNSTRPSIQSLASEWHDYHAGLQTDYQQRLDAMLAAEEKKRKAREEAEGKLRQEKAEAEAETTRRKQAAEAEKARREQEQKDEESRRQQEEQRQQQEAQRQGEEQKQQQAQQQAAQTAAAAAATAVTAQPATTITPAQAQLQSYQAKLTEVRALAAGYSSPNKTKQKVLINRTITQISHTKQSVQSKSLALNTLLQQAKQSGNAAEYGWVVETVAAKLVGQGETRVALQLSSAYSFAAVVLHVCRHDSTLWSCFYALLCERCVYAIPAYLERKNYASQTAHMKAMGYQVQTDAQGAETWEDEQKYLERQQGFIALYAAVCQYTTPHSATSHIHTLPQAWLWLSRLCNHEPRSATASVLYAFLSTAAFALHRKYGQQMTKLLMYARQEVLGRLEKAGGGKTPARKASMARLQLWLNAELDVLRRTGQLSEPEGRALPEGQSQSTEQLQVNDGDFRGE